MLWARPSVADQDHEQEPELSVHAGADLTRVHGEGETEDHGVDRCQQVFFALIYLSHKYQKSP